MDLEEIAKLSFLGICAAPQVWFIGKATYAISKTILDNHKKYRRIRDIPLETFYSDYNRLPKPFKWFWDAFLIEKSQGKNSKRYGSSQDQGSPNLPPTNKNQP